MGIRKALKGCIGRQLYIGAAFMLAVSSAPLSAAAQEPYLTLSDQEAIASALELAKSERFGQAFDALSTVNAQAQTSFQFRFTKARLLTWAQLYQQAEIEYISLLEDHSSNPDVHVSFGFFELFRGNIDAAESYFQTVEKAYPDYTDAQNGLERTQAARLIISDISG